jgi:hypothetical protein
VPGGWTAHAAQMAATHLMELFIATSGAGSLLPDQFVDLSKHLEYMPPSRVARAARIQGWRLACYCVGP